MEAQYDPNEIANAQNIANAICIDVIRTSLAAAVLQQLKSNTPGPLTIDIPTVSASITAQVQRLANDMVTAQIVHPVTGQPVVATKTVGT